MALPKLPRSAKYRPRGLEILHEDRDVIVVDKEPGLLTTETAKGEHNTAENILTDYVRKGCSASRKQAYLVHRLDRDTSGVLIFAKTEEACIRLQETWPDTEKFYLAAIRGTLERKTGLLSSYLAENEDQFVHSVLDPTKGKLAKTAYAVIKETPEFSFVKIRLLTGRKNQIRVQFAEIGHPVAGDRKYARKDPFRERLCLHAKSIAFNHPHTGKRLFFDTPVPGVFARLANGLSEDEWTATEVPYFS